MSESPPGPAFPPVVLAVLLGGALACGGSQGPGAPTGVGDEPVPAATSDDAPAPPEFVDVVERAGLGGFRSIAGNVTKDHLLETTGNGVAVADYDGDGLEDIYLATAQTTDDWRAGRRPFANALYRNRGDGTYADVAESAGVALAAWTNGAYFVDYDNDGDRDLFLTAWGPNRLFRNDGSGRFTDVTDRSGLGGDPRWWSASAAFGDLDGDGDLDVYVTNYCEYDLDDPQIAGIKMMWKGLLVARGPHGLGGQLDALYRNNGDGTFSDVSVESGVAARVRPGYGLGVVLSDLDDDGDLDIYVANDSLANDLWRNDGGLRFSEAAIGAGVASNEDAKEQAGMGTDAGDYDGDGRFDLAVTNFSHDWNTLYRNRGALQFVDDTFAAGLRDTFLGLGWGVKFLDANNDGLLDLFSVNGHIYPEVDEQPGLNTGYRQRNVLYLNRGEGRLIDVSLRAGPALAAEGSSRGLAVADLNLDGALDLLITNIDDAPNLLINESTGGNWLQVRLFGERSNRDGIGARLQLETDGRTLLREQNPFGSYLSQSSYLVHFGVGDATRVDRLTVTWPSGQVDRIEGVESNRTITVREGAGLEDADAPHESQ
jgi:hypothetical protein